NATRSAGVIDSSTTRKAMLIDLSSVTRSAGAMVPPGCPLNQSAGGGHLSTEPLGGCRHRLRDPFAHIAFPSCPGRTQQVEADAAGDCHQPAAGGFDGLLLLRGQGVPAGRASLID